MPLQRKYRVTTYDMVRLQPATGVDRTLTQMMAAFGRTIPTRTSLVGLYNIGTSNMRVEADAGGRATDANRSYYMRPNTALSLRMHVRDVGAIRIHSETDGGDLNVTFEGESS